MSARATENCIFYDILSNVFGNELLHLAESGAFPRVVRTNENDDLIFVERKNVAVRERHGLERERGSYDLLVYCARLLRVYCLMCIAHPLPINPLISTSQLGCHNLARRPHPKYFSRTNDTSFPSKVCSNIVITLIFGGSDPTKKISYPFTSANSPRGTMHSITRGLPVYQAAFPAA